MKSRDSRNVLSVFRLRKRYNKQTKFFLNKFALSWKENTKINVPKKVLQLKYEYFIKFCNMAAIKLI